MLKKIILIFVLLGTALVFNACSYREACGYYGPYYNTCGCGYGYYGCSSCGPYRPIW